MLLHEFELASYLLLNVESSKLQPSLTSEQYGQKGKASLCQSKTRSEYSSNHQIHPRRSEVTKHNWCIRATPPVTCNFIFHALMAIERQKFCSVDLSLLFNVSILTFNVSQKNGLLLWNGLHIACGICMVTYISLGRVSISDVLEERIGLVGMAYHFTNATKLLQDKKQQFAIPSWMLLGCPYYLIYLFMKPTTRKMMAHSEQYLKRDAAGPWHLLSCIMCNPYKYIISLK